jgi:cell division protein FtsQ
LNKLKTIAIWLGIIAYMVLTIAFVDKKEQRLLCNGIEVEIVDSVRTGFIEEEDIIRLLDKNDFEIRGIELQTINTKILEQNVNKLPAVKQAEVYKTIDGKLKIEINQREPILRMVDVRGDNIYIDSEGYYLPVSEKHTSHVLVANGYVPAVDANDTNSVMGLLSQNPENREIQLIHNLYRLANYIYTNKFWKAQFVQLYVDENHEVELIPRVGAHIIKLGDITDFEYKLFKLKALYFKGFNAMGWNNYEIINLKYSNQVICTKR